MKPIRFFFPSHYENHEMLCTQTSMYIIQNRQIVRQIDDRDIAKIWNVGIDADNSTLGKMYIYGAINLINLIYI